MLSLAIYMWYHTYTGNLSLLPSQEKCKSLKSFDQTTLILFSLNYWGFLSTYLLPFQAVVCFPPLTAELQSCSPSQKLAYFQCWNPEAVELVVWFFLQDSGKNSRRTERLHKRLYRHIQWTHRTSELLFTLAIIYFYSLMLLLKTPVLVSALVKTLPGASCPTSVTHGLIYLSNWWLQCILLFLKTTQKVQNPAPTGNVYWQGASPIPHRNGFADTALVIVQLPSTIQSAGFSI